MNEKTGASNENGTDLKEILKIIAKRKWWFIGTIILVMVLGLLYTFLQPVSYKSIYQMEIEEGYINSSLTEKYPGSELTLNYFDSDNTPAIFMSANIFESLKELSPQVDYTQVLLSGDVFIEQGEANIFSVEVSNPDSDLANKIALVLIDSYDKHIRNKNTEALNMIIDQINLDIETLEYENQSFDKMISSLKSDTDTLYAQLYDYIIEYNKDLTAKLEEDKPDTVYYNIVIPPSTIEDDISFIKEEISLYNTKIADNKSEINGLEALRASLTGSKEIIIDRINLLSENPIYKIDNMRIRNIIVFFFLSVILGIVTVFLANFFINIKNRKDL